MIEYDIAVPGALISFEATRDRASLSLVLTDDDDQRRSREDLSKGRGVQVVTFSPSVARRSAQENELDVVQDQGNDP
jgi:hypothetical protein